MAFRKFNQYNEGNNNNVVPPQGDKVYPGGDPLIVSGGSFNRASLAVSGGFTVGFLLILYLKKSWLVGDADAQTITTFAGGLSALMIAIPLFLKDLHRGSTFWKQFYLIAFILVITSALGVFCFLDINDKPVPAGIEAYFVLSVIVSVNTNTAAILFRNFGRSHPGITVSINPEITLLFSMLAFLPGIFFAPEHRLLHAFLMLTFYGLYLIIVLMSAVLFQLIGTAIRPAANQLKVSYDQQIKKAIQVIVDKYKHEALNGQQLIDKLRKEIFQDQQQIISTTSVEMLVTEMDRETDPAEPMIKIYENNHDLVIPRWRQQFDNNLEDAKPFYLAVIYDEQSHYGRTLDPTSLSWDTIRNETYFTDKCYEALTAGTGLSAPLLRDNASLEKKYVITAVIRSPKAHVIKKTYILLTDKKHTADPEALIGAAPADGLYSVDDSAKLKRSAVDGAFQQVE